MSGWSHLARRFVGSIRPGPPAPSDEAWVEGILLPGERELWRRMRNPDRRHAVGVAREVVARWPESEAGRTWPGSPTSPDRDVIAAALLHDVGKVDSDLRTPARVVATIVWAILGDGRARRWADLDGRCDPRRRLGRYRCHPDIGADLLRRGGSAPLTWRWAAEHHRPAASWSVPGAVGELLEACDGD